MAISKGHVILDPSSGSGDTQLTLKAESANVGSREIVKTVFTVKAAGVSPRQNDNSKFSCCTRVYHFRTSRYRSNSS